eukprot:CAMPEP_0174240862 /NCGR_PEP_ID=MMETSP0417-20130205/20921_1 /TAXON_ID=242541 /ORGANISM="Mayorella sp, Strain BSH-02190019" /LENGTH=228 /DNA_ID=CAMNT_0015320025 /DNA_START=91 /DNA_END=777 /DNA_ORIENTATION=-
MSSQDWLKTLERLSCLADDITTDANASRTAAPAVASKLTSSMRRKLTQLTTELDILDSDLHSDSQITRREFERRVSLLQDLQNRLDRLQTMTLPEASVRARAEFTNAPRTGRAWGEAALLETEATKDMTSDDILQQQTAIMAQQDEGIGQITEVVGRVGRIAGAIQEEAVVQTAIIEDLDYDVEHTAYRVKKESHRIETVADKVKTGGCWAIICIEVLVIIVIAIVPG